MDRTKLKNQVKKFEEHLIVECGLGKVTVNGYCRTLSIALRRMRKFRPDESDIKKFMLWMYEKEYSYSHIVNTSLSLEHYAKYKGTPIKLGRPRKPRQVVQDILSESEVTRLIQATKTIREKAIICLLAYSGIRNGELCGLKLKDVNLGDNFITILGGKNRKDRRVNIAAECTTTLIEYLALYKRDQDSFLFTTLKCNNPLSSGDLRKLVRTVAKRAKIGRRVFPHLFRHSLATNLLNRGASLIMIKNQLGHVFIESTMIYATSMPFRTRSEYDFFKPAYM
ncbi:MAG: tyrosine-type recombinase/integrase [Alphaproteobacteria bacterium]|nr:tyrosine-type recombinase/integrase [Alphaproteobacteria bacterium]